jgi:hypothetical protein
MDMGESILRAKVVLTKLAPFLALCPKGNPVKIPELGYGVFTAT